MTPQQYQALGIIAICNGVLVEEFARRMWPNSKSWNHRKYPGRGVCYAARVLLNRLMKQGWVTPAKASDTGARVYYLTLEGRGKLQREGKRRRQDRLESLRKCRRGRQ